MDTFRLVLFETDEAGRAAKLAALRHATTLPRLSVDEVSTLAHFEQALRTRPVPYDLAMVALDDLDGDPIAALGALKRAFPATSFVVCSASNRLDLAQSAHAAGAAGFFRCDSPPELILQVLHLVLGGEAFAIADHLRNNPAVSPAGLTSATHA